MPRVKKEQGGEAMKKEILLKTSAGKIHAQLIGKGSERPTIVMEAGYGDDTTTWNSVISEISLLSQVLVYDRAGVGRSNSASSSKASQEMVRELKDLLTEAQIQPPYLLVAHSFEGIIARMYATFYPAEISGLMLIDATPEDYRERFLPMMPQDFQQAYMQQFSVEEDAAFAASLQQVKATKQRLPIPLLVLAAGKKAHYSKEAQLQWNEMQKEMLDISTDGEFMVAENSAHYIHQEEPAIVVKAIKKMMKKIY